MIVKLCAFVVIVVLALVDTMASSQLYLLLARIKKEPYTPEKGPAAKRRKGMITRAVILNHIL